MFVWIMKNDLEESKNKVARLTRQEAALVQQNARTCMQLSAEEKIRYAWFFIDIKCRCQMNYIQEGI